MAELVVGKYEFHPYELDKNKTLTLDDLKKFLKKAKAPNSKSAKSKKVKKQKNK